ncbi:MAG: PAS domain S-box protein, partial [Chromatiaceae bacterium]|nr:PAS domain S-box protein [Chromatiaceae bacterium]
MFFPKLRAIATTDVITLPASASLADAASTMRQHNIRCLVVTLPEGGYRLVLASHLLGFKVRGLALATRLDAVALPEASVLDPDDSVLEGLHAIRNGSEHLCLVDQRGQLVGIVSYSDLAASLDPETLAETQRLGDLLHGLQPLMLSGELSVREVMERMDAGQFTAALAVEDGRPSGILTQRDLIRLIDEGADLSAPMHLHMSHPLFTLDDRATIAEALQLCRRKRIKRVVVLDEAGRVRGMVSHKDLVSLYYNSWFNLLKTNQQDLDRFNQELRAANRALASLLDERESRLFAAGPLLVCVWSLAPGWSFQYVSPNASEILGYDRELLARPDHALESLMHPEDLGEFRRQFAASLHARAPFMESRFRLRPHQAGERWFYQYAMLEYDDSGQLTSRRGYLLDQHQQVQARHELERQESKFRTLFELYPDATLLIDATDGSTLEFNRAAAVQLGYSPEEFAGMRVSDYEALESEQDIAARIEKILTQGRDEFETRHRCRDGRLLDVQISVSRFDFGDHPLLIAVSRDMTRRKESERQQRESEERLTLATEAAHLGIWDYDIRRDLLLWDERMFALYGLSPASFKGRFEDWSAALIPESLKAVTHDFNALVEFDQPFDVEFQIRRDTDGEIRTLRGLARVMRDEQGRAVRVVGVNEDITERIAASRKLQAEETKFRGLFERSPVGIAMNDFRTGAFLEFNRAINEPAGYTPDEFCNLSYWDLTPIEYLPEEEKALESLKTTGSYGPFQKEYIRKDGSRYPVLLNGFKTTTPEGHEVIWSIIQDISALQEAQREILDREQRLQQLAMQSRTVTWEVDAAGLYTYLSPVAMLVWGYAPEEIIGKRHFYDL